MIKYLLGLGALLMASWGMAADEESVFPTGSTYLKVESHKLQVSRDGTNWMTVVHGEKENENDEDYKQVKDESDKLTVYIPFMTAEVNPTEVPNVTPDPSFIGGFVDGFPGGTIEKGYLPILNKESPKDKLYGKFRNTLTVKHLDSDDYYLVAAGRGHGSDNDNDYTVLACISYLEKNKPDKDTSVTVEIDLAKVYTLDVNQNFNFITNGSAKIDLVYFMSTTGYDADNNNNKIKASVISEYDANTYGVAYYTLEFSNKTYARNSAMKIDDALASENMAVLKYKDGEDMDVGDEDPQQYALVAFSYTREEPPGTPAPLPSPDKNYYSELQNDGDNVYIIRHSNRSYAREEQTFSAVDGKFRVGNLINGHSYYLGVYVVDKFQFATPITFWSDPITPDEIQAFIQKQTCYLLSAGFGREHFVIDFFKAWRDNFLQKFGLGRAFIHWYYATAPQYTPLIYNHRPVQIVVQGVGYTAYVLVRFWYWWVAILLGGLLGWGWYRHRKTV